MNHYPHHIGDFNNATRHLTRVERALYRDLMDLYYDTEKPLPKDTTGRLARLVLAVTDEEKSALDTVLAEFFIVKGGAYHNARCDREISRYQSLRDNASKAGKASAARRANENPTLVEPPLSPRTTNQNQNQNQNQDKYKAQRFAPPPWIDPEAWKGFEAMRVKIRKPMTDRARAMIVKELETLKAQGHDPVAVLAQSEVHAWAGVFPIKDAGVLANGANRQMQLEARGRAAVEQALKEHVNHG